MFQERIKRGESVNMREFLYPLLQGYDSVAMDVDLEIGGSDQTFNMLAGRTLMKAMRGKNKFILFTQPKMSDWEKNFYKLRRLILMLSYGQFGYVTRGCLRRLGLLLRSLY